MDKNVYISAMEIGFNHSRGIKYGDIIKELNISLGYLLLPVQEFTFFKWFIENFDSGDDILKNGELYDGIRRHLLSIIQFSDHNSPSNIYQAFLESKFYMRGSTVKQYIDYLELKESRQQAKKAQQSATIAIGIAILTLLTSIYFSATTPKPPYDVNVLEKPQPIKEIFAPDPIESIKPDNEKAFHLKKSIQELKDELNKADELIRYYESNDYINKEIAKRNIGKI